jgi:hypothetical protein
METKHNIDVLIQDDSHIMQSELSMPFGLHSQQLWRSSENMDTKKYVPGECQKLSSTK